jgi:hypothetical protein
MGKNKQLNFAIFLFTNLPSFPLLHFFEVLD